VRTLEQVTQKDRSFRLWTLTALLLGLLTNAEAEVALRFHLVSRETVESRLGDYNGTNSEREAKLKRMFVNVGCGDHLSEKRANWSNTPNVICVLPGSSERVIIVGAHFDRVSTSEGVADNWSGASLLPSLYEAVRVLARRHTYVFIGFTDEEAGLVGSSFYARNMTLDQVAATAAMINLDTLGLAPSEVWLHRADKRLATALFGVSALLQLPLTAVDFDEVGSTDSESFRRRKIPSLTIHTLTQKSENQMILHTKRDKLSAMNLDYYYDTYHLTAVYLVYLDQFLAEPESAATQSSH
jgi:hypothetical protein